MSPQGQGLSRAGGAAGRAGLSTDTLIAATARQGPAGGVARWGQTGGLCPPNQSTNPPTVAPACPPHLGARWGWFWGAGPTCAGAMGLSTSILSSDSIYL